MTLPFFNFKKESKKSVIIIKELGVHLPINCIQAIVTDYYDLRFLNPDSNNTMPGVFGNVAKFSDNRIATHSGKYIYVYNIENGNLINRIKNSSKISCLIVHHIDFNGIDGKESGEYIISGDHDSVLKIWDLDCSGKCVVSFDISRMGIHQISGSITSINILKNNNIVCSSKIGVVAIVSICGKFIKKCNIKCDIDNKIIVLQNNWMVYIYKNLGTMRVWNFLESKNEHYMNDPLLTFSPGLIWYTEKLPDGRIVICTVPDYFDRRTQYFIKIINPITCEIDLSISLDKKPINIGIIPQKNDYGYLIAVIDIVGKMQIWYIDHNARIYRNYTIINNMFERSRWSYLEGHSRSDDIPNIPVTSDGMLICNYYGMIKTVRLITKYNLSGSIDIKVTISNIIKRSGKKIEYIDILSDKIICKTNDSLEIWD